MDVLQAYQLRDLITQANELGIQPQDVVTILPNEVNGFYLIYFH